VRPALSVAKGLQANKAAQFPCELDRRLTCTYNSFLAVVPALFLLTLLFAANLKFDVLLLSSLSYI
jgi:hypothetical protein